MEMKNDNAFFYNGILPLKYIEYEVVNNELIFSLVEYC